MMLPALAVVALLAQTKTHALPVSATEGTSIASNTPGFMLLLDEGGKIPSDAKSACDNKADGTTSGSTAGFHLEHYFAGAKEAFDQKASVLRQYMGIKTVVQLEAGADPIVAETVDGMEAAYFIRTTPCVETVNAKSTLVYYQLRVMRNTTYADIVVSMYAAGPDAPRKIAREVMQKIGALNYAAVK